MWVKNCGVSVLYRYAYGPCGGLPSRLPEAHPTRSRAPHVRRNRGRILKKHLLSAAIRVEPVKCRSSSKDGYGVQSCATFDGLLQRPGPLFAVQAVIGCILGTFREFRRSQSTHPGEVV